MLEINKMRSEIATKACILHIEIQVIGISECKEWYGNSNYSIMLKRIHVGVISLKYHKAIGHILNKLCL